MLTNTAIPRPLRSEVRRTSVLEHLAELRDYPLVALLAPSGYGKTTVLAQYARETDRPVAWIRLDEEATDVHHVTTLLVGALCRASEALDHVLGGTHRPEDPALDARVLAGHLNATEEHVLIVLDQAGRLSEDGGRWIVRLIEHLREGHQVFISGYPSMAMPLARLVASGQATVVAQQRLAFTADEVQALTDGTPAEAAALVETCGGWPIAVALQRRDRPSLLGPAQLIAEIVADLPPAIRAVLPDLAPCHVWSDGFMRASGMALHGDWLEQLQRCGLPLTPLGEGVFVPHRHLLHWLRAQLEQDPQRARHRYQAVAAAYQATGQPLHAVRTLVDAGNLDEAESLAGTWLAGPWARAEYRSVLSVLLAFPVLQPSLRSQCAYALIEVGRADEARAMLFSLPDEVGFHRECGLALLCGRLGEYAASLAHLHSARTFVRGAEEEAYLAGLQVFSLVSVGRRAEAERFYEAHLASLPSSDPWQETYRLYLNLLVLPLEARDARTGVTDRLTALLQRNGPQDAVRTVILPGLLDAYVLTGRAQLPAAGQWLQQPGLVQAEEWGAAASELLRAQGDAALIAGDLDGADRLYGQARQVASETRFDLGWNQTTGRLADLCFLNGRPDEAAAHVRQITRTGHPEDETLLLYLQGVEALWHRDPDGAARALRAAAETDIASVYRWRALHLLRAAGEHGEVRCPPPPAIAWLEALTATQLAALEPAGNTAAPARTAAATEVPVNVVTFRRLEVRVNGVVVHFPFAKAAELCAYLIVHGPSRREEIVDALWNGSSDARHMDYFRVAVRRLRLALAEADPTVTNPVTYQGGHYALAESYALQRDFDRVTRAAAQLDLPSLQVAWAAYEGDFLPTLDSPWAHDWRAEYREQLIRASLTFAARTDRTLDASAAEAFRQVLRIDRLNEAAYHGLIRHHLNGGEREVAQHLFQRYARLIQEEYGVPPAAALQQLMH